MNEAVTKLIDATVAFATGVYARQLAAGANDASARSVALAAAEGYLEQYCKAYVVGAEIGRRNERARLKALRDGYAVHGSEVQHAMMALELGLAQDPAAISPTADDDGPPRPQH